MIDDSFPDWLEKLHDNIQQTNHRAAIVLSGEKQWVQQQAQTIIEGIKPGSILCVSSEIDGALSPKKARTQLGNEVDIIVFDACQAFEPDAFGAISGTLRGGGIFILLISSEDSIPSYKNSRFMQRASGLFRQHEGVYFLQQGENLPAITQLNSKTSRQHYQEPFRSVEQQQLVEIIEKNALAKKAVPVVITSDRGRGKSSALGLAAGGLLEKGIKNIIITAPRLTTSDPVFKHAKQLLPSTKDDRGIINYQQACLQYIAPDALLEQQPEADLVMVDEAAAIPLPILEQLLECYPHIIFTSTIHGYEGTGRGFALKFNKVLDNFNPDWQLLTMQMPIRWAEDDPVEKWVDHVLCLDAELDTVPGIETIEKDKCTVNLVNRDELIKNEQLLSSLFSLLVYAHYRTQPSDLQHILDDDKVRIYTLEYQQQVLAALLINEEGGFDEELSSAIYRGERRPEGHLLAQTLTFHAGSELAATLRYARVMRIAVHPQLQANGLGSYLLNEVIRQEQQQGIDAIGSSFGATKELLCFWQHAGFEVVRIGFTRDHVSGTHSAVMLKSFTENGKAVFQQTKQRFQQSLDDWLLEALATLPAEMKQQLIAEQQASTGGLNEADWQDINSFVSTHRGYEACMSAIRKLVNTHTEVLETLTHSERAIINARIMQRLNWAETVKSTGLSGKAEALQQLRLAIEKMIKNLKDQ